MENLDQIEKDIVNLLNEISEKACNEGWANKGNKIWTERIKEALGKLGEKKGYSVCATPTGSSFDPEWLYDLVWYKNDSDGRLKTVFLTLECEWSPYWYDIKYDFEKLLLSNAEKRIMICQAKTQEDIDNLFDKFRQSIDSYILGNDTDRFLIIVYKDENGDFIPKLFIRREK